MLKIFALQNEKIPTQNLGSLFISKPLIKKMKTFSRCKVVNISAFFIFWAK